MRADAEVSDNIPGDTSTPIQQTTLAAVDPPSEPSPSIASSNNHALSITGVASLKHFAAKTKRNADSHLQPHMWYIIRPDSTVKWFWDVSMVSLLTYSIFQIPYGIAFTDEGCDSTPTDNFNLFVDCFFLLDCVLNFFMGYLDSDTGLLIHDPGTIRRHYATTWFPFDLGSSIPLDRILCAIATNANNNAFVRMVKLMRWLKGAPIYWRFERPSFCLLTDSSGVDSFASRAHVKRAREIAGIPVPRYAKQCNAPPSREGQNV